MQTGVEIRKREQHADHRPPRRLRWDRHPTGALRLHLGPLAPGMADTLGVIVRDGLRHAAHPPADEGVAVALRAARVRPAAGASGAAGLEMLELQFDAQDAGVLARALYASQFCLIGELSSINADEVHEIVDPFPPGSQSPEDWPGAHDERLRVSLDTLNLGPRTRVALARADLRLVGQLLPLSPGALLRLPLLGRRGLEEIQVGLAALGLCLMPDSPRVRP